MVRDIPLYSCCEHHLVPFHRQGARRVHPQRRRPGHRPVEARPPRRRLRQAPAGAGAAHHARSPTRSIARLQPRGRARGDRGRAPVHVDAGRPQARARPPSPRPCGACSARNDVDPAGSDALRARRLIQRLHTSWSTRVRIADRPGRKLRRSIGAASLAMLAVIAYATRVRLRWWVEPEPRDHVDEGEVGCDRVSGDRRREPPAGVARLGDRQRRR